MSAVREWETGRLVEALRDEGSAVALEEIVRRYQDDVLRAMRANCVEGAHAERAAERVFVEVKRRVHEIEPGEDFERWLRRLTHTLAMGFAPTMGVPADEGGSPKQLMQHRVRGALRALPPEQRTVLVLHQMDKLPLEEVATIVGRDVNEVGDIARQAHDTFVGLVTTDVARTSFHDALALNPGTEIDGKYRVEARLGAGGMGAVYRVRAMSDGHVYALKVLHRSEDADARRAFTEEVRNNRLIDDPRVVRLVDFGAYGELLYFVMEIDEGQPLSLVFDPEEPEPARFALEVATEVTKGLRAVHDAGVVHRDIKPDNVLVSADDAQLRARLIDFGVAVRLGEESAFPEGVAGTPAYMAPEQISGAAPDIRSDIYSTTVMLYELLTGRLPFESEDAARVVIMHLAQDAPRLSHARGDVSYSDRLEALIAKGLQKDPSLRHASAEEFLAELAALVEEQPAKTLPDVLLEPTRMTVLEHQPAVVATEPQAKRWPWLVTVLIAGAIAAWWFLR